MKSARWMSLLTAAALAACGGDGNGSTGAGNGQPALPAKVTGDVQVAVRGDTKLGSVVAGETGQSRTR